MLNDHNNPKADTWLSRLAYAHEDMEDDLYNRAEAPPKPLTLKREGLFGIALAIAIIFSAVVQRFLD